MRRMILGYLISLFLINNNLHHSPPFVTCSSSSSSSFSSYNNNNNSSISSIHCHPDENSALLGFKNSMAPINYSNPYIKPFLVSWKNGTDCCEWDGITCDSTSHHVVELDLSFCGLVGSLDSNNTLFQLRHLRYLDLSYNDFSHSPISPKFCSNFPHLKSFYLSDSNFSGEIPGEISHLSKLQSLRLWSYNDGGLLKMKMSTFYNIIGNMTHLTDLELDGVNIDSTIPPSLTNLSSLILLDLTNCNLRGELPANLLNLPLLKDLYLQGNRGLHANFAIFNWSTSLEWIDLSYLNFYSKLPSLSIQSKPYMLRGLRLRGCNFHGQIPNWVWNISFGDDASFLDFLDLSDNKFNGTINLSSIHSKLPDVGSIYYLNISHNYLKGRLTNLPLNNLEILDLSYNMFVGPLPILPIGIYSFLASNNNFTGPLPSSLCKLRFLQVLDLSNNNLNGELPHCFGNEKIDLTVLNLESNSISGKLHWLATFSKCDSLKYLSLSNNRFEGLVPRSLARCKSLEALNLRGNKLRDEFPYWLATLPHIQVFDLSNNEFFGSLPLFDVSNPFPELQILDLSNNNFSGKIPIDYIDRFKAMMNIIPSSGSPEYMESIDNSTYFYSIRLTFNGLECKYVKIITTLATFDLSNNKFEGKIPNNIGKLVSLHGLNLSHNQLTGRIPPSLGNLTLLNCLDLSSNKLTGQIPQELTSLSSLGVFNVSENQLEGPLPHDNHFETFSVDSYKGNPALCGFPLPECEHGKPKPQPSKGNPDNNKDEDGMFSEWKVVMMGLGFGTFVSLAWGCYMLSIGRPLCLLKLVLFLVDQLEKLIGRRKRRIRRRN